MALPTTAVIAELRELGIKVTTGPGHDPRVKDFRYTLRMPDSVGDLTENYPGPAKLTPTTWAFVPEYSDGHHIAVWGDDATDTAALLILIRDTLAKEA